MKSDGLRKAESISGRCRLWFLLTTLAYAAMPLCLTACSSMEESEGPEEKPQQPLTEQSPATQPMTIEALKSEGIEAARRLMEDYPNSPHAVGLMGMVHQVQGNAEEAMKCWRRCLELNPRMADVYNSMSLTAYRSGQHDEALKLSRRALELAPNMPGVHNRLGRVLVDMGKPKEAIAVLEEGTRLFPKDSQGPYLLGQAYLQSKEHARAKTCYQRAIALQDDHWRAHYGLAAIYMLLQQHDKARQHMARFKTLKARKEDVVTNKEVGYDDLRMERVILAKTHTDVGMIYSNSGDRGKSEEHWRRAALLDPKNTACRIRLVGLYRSTARPREALVVCLQLGELEPENPVTHLNISLLYAELKQYDAAMSAIERARALAPANVRIWQVYETIKSKR
jgi:tetratricopeptide (TPR) repeat protein